MAEAGSEPETTRDADLASLSTFRLPARAREQVRVTRIDQLAAAFDTALETLVLGGGSNTLFLGDFDGRIVSNALSGVNFEAIDADRVRVEAAAGENWHALVRAALDRRLWGLENLALIPGSVGAAPMQNIGAYGSELGDVLEAVRVFDRSTATTEWMPAADCGLGYRSSRFKGDDRYVLLGIRLVLDRSGAPNLDYPSLAAAFEGHPDPGALQPAEVADAVITIRTRKLPEPERIANAGSFFKNPVVAPALADELLGRFENLPNWPTADGTKLSAAWMIDSLGWRGRGVGGARVYEHHALVLVNRGDASGADVLELARSIRASVEDRYGVTLEPEPRLVGGAL